MGWTINTGAPVPGLPYPQKTRGQGTFCRLAVRSRRQVNGDWKWFDVAVGPEAGRNVTMNTMEIRALWHGYMPTTDEMVWLQADGLKALDQALADLNTATQQATAGEGRE